MEKLLIHYDESNYRAQVRNYENAADILQKGIEQYDTMNLPELSTEDFYALFKDPAGLVLDKLTGGQPIKLNGLTVQRKYVFDIVEKPIGYDALIAKIESVLQDLGDELYPPYNVGIHAKSIKEFFELDETGNVVLKQSLINRLEADNKRYAETAAAKNMYQFAKTIIDTAKELELKNISSMPFYELIRNILDSSDTNDPRINIGRIVQFNNNNAFKPQG